MWRVCVDIEIGNCKSVMGAQRDFRSRDYRHASAGSCCVVRVLAEQQHAGAVSSVDHVQYVECVTGLLIDSKVLCTYSVIVT